MAYFNHLIMMEDLILSPSLPGWNCVWSLSTRRAGGPPPWKAEMLCPGSACFAFWGTPLSCTSWRRPGGTTPANTLPPWAAKPLKCGGGSAVMGKKPWPWLLLGDHPGLSSLIRKQLIGT